MCIVAIENNPDSLQFVKHQSRELIIKAINLWPLTINWVRKQTPEFCNLALKLNKNAIHYIRLPFKIPYKISTALEDDHCSICLCGKEEDTSEDKWCSLLECSHKFHVACIKASSVSKKNCPLCRTNFPTTF
jgi:hypothetical protein